MPTPLCSMARVILWLFDYLKNCQEIIFYKTRDNSIEQKTR